MIFRVMIMEENEHKQKQILPLLAVLCLGLLVWSSVAQAPTGQKHQQSQAAILPVYPGPDLSAPAYLVKIIGENKILLRRREWKRVAPASLTKLMTSLLALNGLNLAEKIFFSREYKNVEEKTSPVPAGETIAPTDVIRLTMIGSANDGAIALADQVGRNLLGESSSFAERQLIFKEEMNRLALKLGLADSHFENPVGWDQEGHYSSAEDLAKLAEYIWFKYPEIWKFSRNSEISVFGESGREYKMENTDELFKEYPAILGSKTGFTDNAKQSLLLLYPVRPDKTAVVVILGSEDRAADGRKIIKWLETLSLN